MMGRKNPRQCCRVRCPVLIVYGDDDRLLPKESFRWLADSLPDAALVGLKDCGHGVVWGQGDRLLSLVENFLSDSGR